MMDKMTTYLETPKGNIILWQGQYLDSMSTAFISPTRVGVLFAMFQFGDANCQLFEVPFPETLMLIDDSKIALLDSFVVESVQRNYIEANALRPKKSATPATMH